MCKKCASVRADKKIVVHHTSPSLYGNVDFRETSQNLKVVFPYSVILLLKFSQQKHVFLHEMDKLTSVLKSIE